MLAKANYERIAAILGGDFAVSNPDGQAAIFCVTLSLADYFKQDNSAFDRSKFYGAVFGTENPFLAREHFTAAGKVND